MSDPKWTPGPWKVSTNPDGSPPHWIDPVDREMVTGSIATVWSAWVDSEGNARLIAAAPQLYDVLEVALSMLELLGTPDDAVVIGIKSLCEETLARARGD